MRRDNILLPESFFSTPFTPILNSAAPGSIMVFLWTDLVLDKDLLRGWICFNLFSLTLACTVLHSCISSLYTLVLCLSSSVLKYWAVVHVCFYVVFVPCCHQDAKKQTWTLAQRCLRKQICKSAANFPCKLLTLVSGFYVFIPEARLCCRQFMYFCCIMWIAVMLCCYFFSLLFAFIGNGTEDFSHCL